jgi:hypothetical protein
MTSTVSLPSPSEEDDESESGEEVEIHDGRDVLEYENKGTVIPSSIKDTESESESQS